MENHSLSQIKPIFDNQRNYFDSGNTRPYAFRIKALKALRATILKYKAHIMEALYNDFKKPSYEAYIGEVGVTINDIDHTIEHLANWMEDQYVSTPISIQPARSRIISDPKGIVMIFSPWNYPFNLTMIPLIGAIAAGNCVLIKPAHETPHISSIIQKIIEETYKPEHIFCVMGEGKVIGEMLLDNFLFNHIFFTGSPKVGSWVMSKAATTLTPVTLELGGKSPTIVDKNVNLKVAVNRISWAKYFNAGQTCTSPDYILVHKDIKSRFIEVMLAKIKELYGEDAQKSPFYPRLVNRVRFDVVSAYLTQGKVLYGGRTDANDNYIEPTVMEIEDQNVPLMKEEIFGPIMPIIEWSEKEELIDTIRKNRYPLTCYIFSKDQKLINYVLEKVEFGSGCVNDTMAQFANSNFPFGGIQNSGIGNYHGKYSFDTFSNLKPILTTATWIDPDLRYAPYTSWKQKLAKMVLE